MGHSDNLNMPPDPAPHPFVPNLSLHTHTHCRDIWYDGGRELSFGGRQRSWKEKETKCAERYIQLPTRVGGEGKGIAKELVYAGGWELLSLRRENGSEEAKED